MIVCRYADDMVLGCEFETDGKQLLADLKNRLEQFGLSLHEGKTRLIEFGRFAACNRAAAGQRRPETLRNPLILRAAGFRGFSTLTRREPRANRADFEQGLPSYSAFRKPKSAGQDSS